MSEEVVFKLEEMRNNRKEAIGALQEAQARVNELTALVQRQSGAITALEELRGLSDENLETKIEEGVDDSQEIS